MWCVLTATRNTRKHEKGQTAICHLTEISMLIARRGAYPPLQRPLKKAVLEKQNKTETKPKTVLFNEDDLTLLSYSRGFLGYSRKYSKTASVLITIPDNNQMKKREMLFRQE